MSRMRKLMGVAAAAVLACGVVGAADEPAKPWSNVTDLGIVATSGNSESKSFAFGNKYAYKWAKAEFNLDAVALRAESTARSVVNVDGVVTETNVTTTSAELYGLAAKYRRDFSERFFWYARGGWLQNTLIGIDSRLIGGGGVGYTFVKSDVNTLTGELGVEYTDDQFTEPTFVPGEDLATDSTSYATARGFLGWERKIGAASKFNAELEAFDNLDQTSDWRARALASVTASMTSKVAIKAAYTMLYDAEPVVLELPDTGTVGPLTPAKFEYDDTDTIFTATLVITF